MQGMVLPLKTVVFKLYEREAETCRKRGRFPAFTRARNRDRIGGRADEIDSQKERGIYVFIGISRSAVWA